MSMTKNQILEKLESFNEIPELSGYRFGLAGSYARGDNTENSDIDIVVDTDDMSLRNISRVCSLVWDSEHVDVLLLKLLEQADKEIDILAESMDLPINDESVYKTIKEDVIWV